MGFALEIYEKDTDYFNAAVKRFKDHIKQGDLFKEKGINTYGNQLEL